MKPHPAEVWTMDVENAQGLMAKALQDGMSNDERVEDRKDDAED